jgi:hypothetical protein
MSPECFLMIAQVCLPSNTTRVPVHAPDIVTVAYAEAPGVQIEFLLSTDEDPPLATPPGFVPLCRDEICIQYARRAETTLRDGHTSGLWRFIPPGQTEPRPFKIDAVDTATYTRTVLAMSLMIEEGGRVVYIPLADLVDLAHSTTTLR